MMLSLTSSAQKDVTISDVVNGTFKAERHVSVTPMPDGENYACLSDGKIKTYSYKKQTDFFPSSIRKTGKIEIS